MNFDYVEGSLAEIHKLEAKAKAEGTKALRIEKESAVVVEKDPIADARILDNLRDMGDRKPQYWSTENLIVIIEVVVNKLKE